MIHKKDFSVYLRAFEPDDYLLINKWRNDMEMQKLTCGPIRFVSTEMEKVWVHDKMMNNRSDIYLAVCVNDGIGRIIGYTSLNNIDYINRKVCAGGIVIGDNDYRDGQALCEVLYMILDYSFNELNMNRVYGKFLTTHVLTRSLMQAFFFKEEGVNREDVFKCGKYFDTCSVSILRKEFWEHESEGDYVKDNIIRRMVGIVRVYRKKY